MKRIKLFAAFIICTGYILSTSSCFVLVKKDNSKPGWNKNSKNPHHPATTNPGRSQGKIKK
jgi:hypothetical protein